jgi:predicted anti-sigma-YlaC factor YlaD
MLSRFEVALLDRHLRRCEPCRTFAAVTAAQTELLRNAPLERPETTAAVFFLDAAGARHRRRRHLLGAVGAVAAAASAAAFVLTPAGGGPGAATQQSAAGSGSGAPLLAVFAEQPTAAATFDVPRLRVVSPSSADGAVRGYYGVPAI